MESDVGGMERTLDETDTTAEEVSSSIKFAVSLLAGFSLCVSLTGASLMVLLSYVR